ncbi:DUF4224 domain-containing protein [Salinicola rhizosphaerae]|uniref:DUF4224 domain-containing protein n=1 Tax=Salinicola rhizosphaerae TaxID=1443141 RepID=A0ABQ3EFK1_9GAMM|nr:DUF4224 domain-containing protein [Salinicola rhizosphaerae]GHB30838.1 hypothetical protein GCM10009038_32070 [Salinicola rhizosphaerae]
MALMLSRDELKELTGTDRRAHQRMHLDAMGIPYCVNASGWPVVLRSAAMKVLGGEAANDAGAQEATIDMEFLNS